MEKESVNLSKKRVRKISVLNEEFDFRLFVLIAQKKWKWIVIILAVSLVCSYIYLRYAQRVYEESCIIQIGTQNTANKILGGSGNNYLYQNGDEMAEAVELMRSKIYLEKVFRSLSMHVSYYTQGTFKDHEQYRNSTYMVEFDTNAYVNLSENKIFVQFNKDLNGSITFRQGASEYKFPFTSGEWIYTKFGNLKIIITNPSLVAEEQGNIKKNIPYFVFNTISLLANQYSQLLTIKVINADAKTIQISCKDFDDKKASDIANAIGQQYILYIVDKRQESTENILNFIDEQLNVIFLRLKNTELQLDTLKNRRYKKSFGLDKEIYSANMSHVVTLEDQIANNDLNLMLMHELETKVKNEKESVDPADLVILLNFSEIGEPLKEYLTDLHSLLERRMNASYDVTEKSLSYKSLDTMINQEENTIMKCISLLNSNLEEKQKYLEGSINEIKSKLDTSVEGSNIETIRLQRLSNIDEKYYDNLLERKAEYSIYKAGVVPESQVLDYAMSSWIAVYPSTTLSISIAIISAIVISIILLIVNYLFYNNLTSIEEVERLTESPIVVLGIIPKYTKEIPVSQIIVNHNPKSILAEAFRAVRTNLQYISADEGSKVISITSTISGEGKTFISVNLGGIIAYSGKKVILLDLDMRRPRIHTTFGLDNSKGMSTLLIGKYTVEDVIQKSDTENLDIITAGPIPPNPSELVIGKTMDDVLDALRKKYDIIIADNPPVGLVTDGIAMLQRSDYPIYIMRADYSKREFIYFIDRLYFENHFHKLSIILNGVDFNRHKYGYSYYKYGYYGYGYGYTYGQGNYYEI